MSNQILKILFLRVLKIIDFFSCLSFISTEPLHLLVNYFIASSSLFLSTNLLSHSPILSNTNTLLFSSLLSLQQCRFPKRCVLLSVSWPSISFFLKPQRTQIWNRFWTSKLLPTNPTSSLLGTRRRWIRVPVGLESLVVKTESLDSFWKVSNSAARLRRSPLWLGSVSWALKTTALLGLSRTCQTSQRWSFCFSLIMILLASFRRRFSRCLDSTVSICRITTSLVIFRRQSTVWRIFWLFDLKKTGFPIKSLVWISRICKTSTFPVTISRVKFLTLYQASLYLHSLKTQLSVDPHCKHAKQ